MKVTLGGERKVKCYLGAAEKVVVFGFLKSEGKVFTKVIADAWSETLLSAKLCQIVSSIQAAGEVITCWMYRNSSIFVSIILNSLQQEKSHQRDRQFLVVVARQGIFSYPIGKLSTICASLMVFRRSILVYF